MAIERMQKVLIGGLKEDFPLISRRLQSLSILHIAEIREIEGLGGSAEGGDDARHGLERIEGAMEFLRTYHANKRGLLTPKPEMTAEEILDYDDSRVFAAADEAEALEQQLAQLRSEELMCNNTRANLAPYGELDLPVAALKDSAYTVMRLGMVPQAAMDELKAQVESFAELTAFSPYEEQVPVFLAAHRSYEEPLRDALRGAGFTEANLSVTGLVKDELKKLDETEAEIAQKREAIGKQALNLAKEAMPRLQVAFDKYNLLVQREEAGDNARMTGRAFLVSGWIRKRDGEKLREALFHECPDLMIEEVEPEEGEVPPTAVSNSKLLKPFEAVTDMYSTPAYNGMDPTALMAPFFFAFFGMMLSDAGYGAILTLGALFFLKRVKPKGMMGAITTIIAMGGISTILWGALFGGWFGEELIPALWFVPMDEPLLMMGICLVFGVLQISVGLLAKGYMLIREGKIIDAICDVGFLLFILLGLPLAVLGIPFMGILAVIGVVGLFFTAGRANPGILKKLTGGFSAVYGLTGYVSDILSYTRLFGLGLATGVIGMVFNTLATMLMASPIGIPFGIAILVAGHGFNLVINVLGAYVHSCRLQYIEFYSKFFEGNGRAFLPYGYRTKYVQIKN